MAGISRVGQRRQVVIPKKIYDRLGLREGDMVEVSVKDNVAIVKPRKLADLGDVLSAKEAEQVRKGESQLRRGHYVTLEQLEHDLDYKIRSHRAG